MPALERLVLDRNQLTGTLPDELRSVTTLQTIAVEWNDFTGSIPDLGDMLVPLIHSCSRFARLPSSTGMVPSRLVPRKSR